MYWTILTAPIFRGVLKAASTARRSLGGSECVPLQGLGDVVDIPAIDSGFDGCVSGEVALGLERDAISSSIAQAPSLVMASTVWGR
jgi:hypothetical protein